MRGAGLARLVAGAVVGGAAAGLDLEVERDDGQPCWAETVSAKTEQACARRPFLRLQPPQRPSFWPSVSMLFLNTAEERPYFPVKWFIVGYPISEMSAPLESKAASVDEEREPVQVWTLK